MAREIQAGKKLHIQEDMKGVFMKRLTKKYHGHYCSNENGGFYDLYKKLGKLEDAEELCEKVVEQPIYFNGIIVEKNFAGHTALYQFKTGRVFLFDLADRYVLSLDPQYYGKAWALTKEELQ